MCKPAFFYLTFSRTQYWDNSMLQDSTWCQNIPSEAADSARTYSLYTVQYSVHLFTYAQLQCTEVGCNFSTLEDFQ